MERIQTGRDTIEILRGQLKRLHDGAANAAIGTEGATITRNELNHAMQQALRTHLFELERTETECNEKADAKKAEHISDSMAFGVLGVYGIGVFGIGYLVGSNWQVQVECRDVTSHWEH